MKSDCSSQRHLPRLRATYCVYPRTPIVESTIARAITDAVLVAAIAAILASYAAIFVGVYRWSHYDPLFPAESALVVRSNTLRIHSRAPRLEREGWLFEANGS